MAARVRRCADYTLVDAILRPPGVFRDTGRSGGSRPRNPDFGTEAVRPTPLAPRQQALTACAKYDPSVLKICRNFGSCALSPRAPRHLRPAASTRRPSRNLARSIGTMAGWEGRDRCHAMIGKEPFSNTGAAWNPTWCARDLRYEFSDIRRGHPAGSLPLISFNTACGLLAKSGTISPI